MIYFEWLISASLGYSLGCIQTAYLLCKLIRGIDIRNYGSNNAGASNVTIVMGLKYGVVTALVDILKALAAVALVGSLFPGRVELLFVAGAFSIIGHIFPFYLKFKGGKGAASLIGMTLAIDYKLAAATILTIILVTLAMDYIALGSMGMFTAMPVLTYFLNYSMTCVAIGIILAFICYYKHEINIRRILSKEEVGLRTLVKK